MLKKERIFLVIALGINSFSTLVFETIVLKQLSFIMGSWNYILSVVLCSLMIGMGIGALLVLNRRINVPTTYVSLAQAMSVIITFGILFRFDTLLSFCNNLIVIGLYLSIPFILFGYLVALVLQDMQLRARDSIGWVYSSDLVGAALGGILGTFVIIPFFGANKALVFCMLLFILSSVLFDLRYAFKCSVARYVAGSALLLLLFLPIDGLIERHRGIRHTPLYSLLRDGGILEYTGWSPLHRIDVVDADGSLLVTYNGFPQSRFPRINDPVTIPSMLLDLQQRFMKGLYPFIQSPKKILIIGPGAGPDLFYSKMWLEKNAASGEAGIEGAITGVEIDPLVVDLMKHRFSHSNKGIFNDRSVRIVVDDGRHFLETTTARFDLIYYPGVDTPFAFTNVLGINPYLRAENFLYTYEGLRMAYEKLSEDGVLMITVGYRFSEPFSRLDLNKVIRKNTPRQSRLLATYKQILQDTGIKRWVDFVEVSAFVVPYDKRSSIVDVMLKLSKKPIDRSLAPRIISSYPVSNNGIFLDPQALEALAIKNVPATDDRPFYYNFPLNDIPKVISGPLRLFSAILLCYFLAAVFIFKFIKKTKHLPLYVFIFLYFITIGVSFIVTELLYAHQAALFIGNSFIGIAIFVPIMLLFGGAGSLAANRLLNGKFRLSISLLPLLFYCIFLPHITDVLGRVFVESSIYTKTAVFPLLFMPAGVFLGIFFPAGFLITNKLKPSISAAWLYSLDIIGSIVGILLGVCLPIQFGYMQSMQYLTVIFLIQSVMLLWLRHRLIDQ